jgi:phage-related protein
MGQRLGMSRPRKMLLVFYRTPAGTEVVRDWLRGLESDARGVVGQDLMRVQYRWPVGMPLCRPMGDNLWEVRSDLPGNRIARVVFTVRQGKLLVVHGFIKKSQKTPKEDFDLARKRKREFEP